MSAALATLSGTQGVLGTAVFDHSGVCVATDLKPPYEPVLVAEVVKHLNGAFDVIASIDDSGAQSMFAACESGGVVFRSTEAHTLVVLTQPEANLNVVNVALNVVALNFSREVANSNALASQHALSSQNMLGSQMHGPLVTQSDALPTDQIPPDAVGKSNVTQLLTVYANYMGPAAKVVLKQHLAAFGVTARTLRKGQWQDLLNRLGAKIPSAERRREFLVSAERIKV